MEYEPLKLCNCLGKQMHKQISVANLKKIEKWGNMAGNTGNKVNSGKNGMCNNLKEIQSPIREK